MGHHQSVPKIPRNHFPFQAKVQDVAAVNTECHWSIIPDTFVISISAVLFRLLEKYQVELATTAERGKFTVTETLQPGSSSQRYLRIYLAL